MVDMLKVIKPRHTVTIEMRCVTSANPISCNVREQEDLK